MKSKTHKEILSCKTLEDIEKTILNLPSDEADELIEDLGKALSPCFYHGSYQGLFDHINKNNDPMELLHVLTVGKYYLHLKNIFDNTSVLWIEKLKLNREKPSQTLN